jgi:stress-induced morphogen
MMEKLLHDRLKTLNPISLNIIDESHKHQGHRPNSPNIGTHFKITIIAECFKGMSLLQRHRMVYEILDKELKGQLHALSIKALTPDQQNP